jgi:hypothetical protein
MKPAHRVTPVLRDLSICPANCVAQGKLSESSCLYFRFPVFLNAMTQTELKRQIGLFDTVVLIAGDMVVIGILVNGLITSEFLPLPNGGAR